MVLAGLIFLQLDDIRSLHMIDNGELAVLGTDYGHIGFNLVGINHGFLRLAQCENLSEFYVISFSQLFRQVLTTLLIVRLFALVSNLHT
jgi:hypothetical protein